MLKYPALTSLVMSAAFSNLAIAADAGAGKQVVSARCAICHKFEKGDGNGMGPNLFGIVGRKAASLPDFSYSGALKASKITWSEDNLSKWVGGGPAKMVPGTKMVFPGITSKKDVANAVAYLATLK